MVKSTFKKDKKEEELYGEWLDENLYKVLANKNRILDWRRITGEKLQKSGIDVIMLSDSELFIIDEKASLEYINKDIPTFAFEVINTDSGAKGWLFNESLRTEYYLLSWPNAKGTIECFEDFTNCNVMLIKKQEVINLLKERNITEEIVNKCIQDNREKINEKNNRLPIFEEYKDDIYLSFNFVKKEKPINVVIKKHLLMEKALFYATIGEKCPKCGKNLIERNGKNGKFRGCNFPVCKYSQDSFEKVVLE